MSGSKTQVVAGVDLGSHSFHMIVVRVDETGRFHVLDKLRERVRLAAGLTEKRTLSQEAQERAIESLRRMGQRLRGLPPGAVRAVGTNTLRQSKDAQFLDRAQEALGHPIEIISGMEEARLIYLGVSHSLAASGERRLVVDIGGGSTECIIGEGFDPVVADSLYMGCVSYTMRYFGDGRITKEAFQRAEMAARIELEPIVERFKEVGWQGVVGSSGTVIAARKVIEANGWAEANITDKGIKRLRKALIAQGKIDKLSLPGLEADRAIVFPGGLAILKAIFDMLELETMQSARGALREGLIYDLLGRIRHEDVRDKTIRALAKHYSLDRSQSKRVRRTALDFFDQAHEALGIGNEEARQFVEWASIIHEIGLSISYAGYHKHGAYLLENLEMPGFSRNGRAVLAAIVRSHRRKLTRELFDHVRPQFRDEVLRLSLLFRLAVKLNRSRSADALPDIKLEANKERVQLRFPENWLENHPLSRADLVEEVEAFRSVGFELGFS